MFIVTFPRQCACTLGVQEEHFFQVMHTSRDGDYTDKEDGKFPGYDTNGLFILIGRVQYPTKACQKDDMRTS